MKVLTALTYYYPHWTGLTAFAQRIAEGLAARGHQITVVTARYQPSLPAEEIYNGVRILRLPAWLRLSRGQVMPSFLPTIRRLVREHDVVQTHSPMLETWPVAWLAHRAGRKTLMTHHGDLVMPAGLWNQVVQRSVGYMLGRGAAAADAISIYTRDYTVHSDFLRLHVDKVIPVYPPIIFPRADQQAARAWRRELGLEDCHVVGFAGRFVEEKGFDYLLKALPLVHAQMPNTKFVFAGEHRVVYENFYQRCMPLIEAARNDLIMLGLITDCARLAEFYALCDVFTLPSRTDCFASVQVEAMLSGTPVVATNIPGAREVVKATGMGLLVEPRDEHALAEGILRVLRERERYVRPYEHIRSVFDPDKAISDYERILSELLP